MARDFSASQGKNSQEYVVYFKNFLRCMAEKHPPFGRFDFFQTRPSISHDKKYRKNGTNGGKEGLPTKTCEAGPPASRSPPAVRTGKARPGERRLPMFKSLFKLCSTA